MSNEELLKKASPYELFWTDDIRVLAGKEDVLCVSGRCYVKPVLTEKQVSFKQLFKFSFHI